MEKHKEWMEWLKENDPITYHELYNNPAGVKGNTGWITLIVIVIGLFCLGIYLFGGI